MENDIRKILSFPFYESILHAYQDGRRKKDVIDAAKFICDQLDFQIKTLKEMEENGYESFIGREFTIPNSLNPLDDNDEAGDYIIDDIYHKDAGIFICINKNTNKKYLIDNETVAYLLSDFCNIGIESIWKRGGSEYMFLCINRSLL